MARYGNTILTSAGLDLAKRTVNGTSTFKITRVVTSGDSTLQNATIEQVLGLTSLNSIVQTGTVTAFDTSNPKQIGLKAQFVNRGLTDQYKIFAVGIYAQEAGKSEILYAVTPAVDPETMPARPSDSEASFTFTLQIYAAVANSSSVTISATTEGVVKSINGSIKPDTNGDLALSVGGRNLLTNTRTLSDVWNGDTETVDGFTVAKATQTNSGLYDPLNWGNLHLKPNTDYVLTFYAKASRQTQIYSYLYNIGTGDDRSTGYNDGSTPNTLTTDYQRYVVHFHTDAIPSGRLISCLPVRLTDNGVTAWIYGVQLEEGNIATQWRPSPDDLTTAITNEATARTNADSSVLTQAKAYTDTAKSDLTTTLNNNYYQKTDIDSKLSAATQGVVKSINGSIKPDTNGDLALSVGGRNLLDGETGKEYSATGATSYQDVVNFGMLVPADQEHYVLSFDAKATTTGQQISTFLYCQYDYSKNCAVSAITSSGYNGQVAGDGRVTTALTTDYKRYWIKYTINPANKVYLNAIIARIEANSGTATVSVKNAKLETGTIPTDWSPAPEYVENEINTGLANEATARTNADSSVLSQAKAYTDTAKSDLTAAMNTADTSVLGKANAYTDFALRGVWTPTVITTAIDLNNIKACGNYFIQNALGTTSNTPIPNAWLYVRVEGVPNRLTQTVWKDIDPTIQWVRLYTETWGNWTQITKAI